MRPSLRRQGHRILQTAAVVVLILNIGFGTAVATSGNVRAKVIRFLMEMNDSYMSIGFTESEGEIIIPEEWEGRYFPTYIPQGYSIQRCVSGAEANLVEYVNAEGNTLTIEVCDINSFSRINTEKSVINFIPLHGVEATILRQPYGAVCIIWSLGDCWFISKSTFGKTSHGQRADCGSLFSAFSCLCGGACGCYWASGSRSTWRIGSRMRIRHGFFVPSASDRCGFSRCATVAVKRTHSKSCRFPYKHIANICSDMI